MSDDQQPPETPGPKTQSAAEQIEELFRLADLASSRSKASTLDEARRRERARERLARILDRERPREGSDPEISHEWVLDVLSDLAAYAHRHNLVELEETLRVTQFAAILLLRGQEED